MTISGDEKGGGGTSPVFQYGDHQAFAMLNTKVTITAEDYETVCKETFMLKFFLNKGLTKRAKEALAALSAKLQDLDRNVLCLLEDACQAEEDGEAALDKPVVTFKQEEKRPATKVKLAPFDFEVWGGEQEKFFAWMSTVVKMISALGIDDGQAQLMVLKKLPEKIRNQCEHLATFALVKDWLMARYGTDNGLLSGVMCVLKKVTKTERATTFLDDVLPEILKIQGLVDNFSNLSGEEEEAVCQGVYSKEVVGRITELLPQRVLSALLMDQENAAASSPTEGLYGWKKYRQQYRQIVNRCRAMERNRAMYEGMEASAKKNDYSRKDGAASLGDYTKVRTKAVAVHKRAECVFCRQDKKDCGHYPLSSKYCHSIMIPPEQLQKTLRNTNACPTCLQEHGPTEVCDDKTRSGFEKKCREGCTLDSKPLCFYACVHGRAMRTRTKAVTIQDGSEAINIPLVETWQVGGNEVRVQYDSGATITLIGSNTLKKFPAHTYKLGRNRRVLCSAYVDSKTSAEMAQDVEITVMGKVFLALVIKEELEGVEAMEVEVPGHWRTSTSDSSLVIGGGIDILAGGNLGRLFPDQVDKFKDMKLFRSNFTDMTFLIAK